MKRSPNELEWPLMTDMPSDKIKAEHNPWYLLATLHGEAESTDDEVHARNRTTWNRFMAAALTEDDRALLINERGFSDKGLTPFSVEELADVGRRFGERYRQATGEDSTTDAILPLPNLKQEQIDFSNIVISLPFYVEGFLFPKPTNFSRSTFCREVDFSKTSFSSHAGFQHAIFEDETYFSKAFFFSRAVFLGTKFSNWTDFWRTMFFNMANFKGTSFSDRVGFSRATFSRRADFSSATFSKFADFSHTTFSGLAGFKGASFSDKANFSAVTFSDRSEFPDATFCGQAQFTGTIFCTVKFSQTIFSGEAAFSGATFSCQADFSGATFEKETLFLDAKMEGPTSFRNAKFISEPPQFFEAKLHQGTVWRDVEWPPPPKDHIDAGLFVDAYACLKLEMDRLKKHEDELDFFARELQSRRVLQGDWQPVSELNVCGRAISVPPLEVSEKAITPKPRTLFGRTFTLPSFTIKARTIQLLRPAPGLAIALYGWLSDYGRSYVRPLYGLLITAAAGVLPLWWHLCGLWRAIGHSLANTFGVFGFRRELIGADVLTALPGLLKVLAAAQTVAGIVLLFLLGVAIRNRFRMK